MQSDEQNTPLVRRMTPQDAVAALDAVPVGDPDAAHGEADRILLESVHPDVAAAYARLVERSPWWATA